MLSLLPLSLHYTVFVLLTGLPLPFISAGKTFLVTLLAALGIVQSISLHREEKI